MSAPLRLRFAMLSALALTGVLALASLATVVPTASAQTGVEVVHEGSTTEACDPCDIHLTGESHIVALPVGVIVSSCQDEFEGTINQDGTGEVTWTGNAHDAPGCNVSNCTGTGEDHWPLNALVEIGGEALVTMRVCYRASSGVEVHCDLVLEIPDTGTHEQQVSTEDLCVSNTRRVEGAWQSEATTHDALEVVHGESDDAEIFRELPVGEPCNPCEIHLTGEATSRPSPAGSS